MATSCQYQNIKAITAASQTKPVPTVAKGNQITPKTVRMINHMVQTAWTSEKIEAMKDELRKHKDKINSDALEKMKNEMKQEREKLKQGVPKRSTMPSTSHQAVIERHAISSGSDSEPDLVFEKPIQSQVQSGNNQLLVQNLQDENERLIKELAEKDNHIYNDEIDDLNEKLSKTKNQIKRLESDNHILEEQIDALEEHNKILDDEAAAGPINPVNKKPFKKAELAQEIHDLHDELEAQDKKLEKLEKELKEANEGPIDEKTKKPVKK